MDFCIKTFEELTLSELYEILRLRGEVFVVEQDCVYQDVDNKDSKALHVTGTKNGQIIAYARLFKAGDYFDQASIGRVVVKQSERMYGYGHILMKEAIQGIEKFYNTREIKISAQYYLEKFYASHGFVSVGETYLEDGIPHIAMIRK